MELFQSVYNVVLDRTPEELIGAVLIALVFALVMTGLYTLGRRKVTDTVVLLSSLMLFANVVSMAVAAGYVVHAQKKGIRVNEGPSSLPQGGPGPGGFPGRRGGPGRGGFRFPGGGSRPGGFDSAFSLGVQVLRAADANHDGQLSPDEAALFVKEADTAGNGSLDVAALNNALNMRSRGPAPRAAERPSDPGPGRLN